MTSTQKARLLALIASAEVMTGLHGPDLAKALSISKTTFYRRKACPEEWTIDEILSIVRLAKHAGMAVDLNQLV